jgi:hypothetical protein
MENKEQSKKGTQHMTGLRREFKISLNPFKLHAYFSNSATCSPFKGAEVAAKI